jgi:hypothetical protein
MKNPGQAAATFSTTTVNIANITLFKTSNF